MAWCDVIQTQIYCLIKFYGFDIATIVSIVISEHGLSIDIITHTGIGNGSCARDILYGKHTASGKVFWCASALLPVSLKVPNKDFTTPSDESVVP